MNISRIRNGVLFISVGIVLLLNNLDYVSWSVWAKILSLWPVLLIAIGIELILKKTFLSFLTILSPILIFLAILGPVWLNHTEWRVDYLVKGYKWSKPWDEKVKKVYLRIDLKVGALDISSDSVNLIDADLDYWNQKPLTTYRYSEEDSLVLIRIKQAKKDWKDWVWKGWREKRWRIGLSNKIPFDLKFYSKASSAFLSLSDILIDDLYLDLKATDLKLKLGKKEYTKVKIKSKASRIRILLPVESGIKIESDATLTSFEFSGEISVYKEDNRYQSINYQTSPYKIDLHLDGKVSKLEVETY